MLQEFPSSGYEWWYFQHPFPHFQCLSQLQGAISHRPMANAVHTAAAIPAGTAATPRATDATRVDVHERTVDSGARKEGTPRRFAPKEPTHRSAAGTHVRTWIFVWTLRTSITSGYLFPTFNVYRFRFRMRDSENGPQAVQLCLPRRARERRLREAVFNKSPGTRVIPRNRTCTCRFHVGSCTNFSFLALFRFLLNRIQQALARGAIDLGVGYVLLRVTPTVSRHEEPQREAVLKVLLEDELGTGRALVMRKFGGAALLARILHELRSEFRFTPFADRLTRILTTSHVFGGPSTVGGENIMTNARMIHDRFLRYHDELSIQDFSRFAAEFLDPRDLATFLVMIDEDRRGKITQRGPPQTWNSTLVVSNPPYDANCSPSPEYFLMNKIRYDFQKHACDISLSAEPERRCCARRRMETCLSMFRRGLRFKGAKGPTSSNSARAWAKTTRSHSVAKHQQRKHVVYPRLPLGASVPELNVSKQLSTCRRHCAHGTNHRTASVEAVLRRPPHPSGGQLGHLEPMRDWCGSRLDGQVHDTECNPASAMRVIARCHTKEAKEARCCQGYKFC